ncbi:hypothetical protein J0835_01525 [Bacillus cereus group sp. Sample62]|uniref:hypothetical protein n=1 Tax=Bacillus cereus group TaxID=86661 RepID=UPI00086EEC0C|nr:MULTISPECIES: hypothetical protein [Bacillus cereus group]SCN29631.1 Protein of unknown function [Bacillus cereus]HDR4727487.1 hypothetical protein [Bacillus cereus]HDX9552631.1 hypothetical protein [Bacillus thuringiensis]
MDWLTALDLLYTKEVQDKNNKKFIYSPNHNLEAISNDVSFVFRKQLRKTKILFEDGYGRKIYLTDVDIINIMAEAPENIFVIMQNWLREYEKNKFENLLVLEVEGRSFEVGFAMPKETDENHEDIKLFKTATFKSVADFDVSYYDLMILISLIVDKEYVVSESSATIRKSRQLKKFIILSSFYRSKNYGDILKEKGYDVDLRISDVYHNSKIAKEIDLIFNQIEF